MNILSELEEDLISMVKKSKSDLKIKADSICERYNLYSYLNLVELIDNQTILHTHLSLKKGETMLSNTITIIN